MKVVSLHYVREKEYFQALFNSMPEEVLVYDSDGVISDANQNACMRLGYSLEELRGMTVRQIEPSVEKSAFLASLNKVAEGQMSIAQSTYLCKDGSHFPVETRIVKVQLSSKNLFLQSSRDITPWKEMESRFRYLMTHNEISGLPNKAQFQNALNEEVARAQRYGGAFATIILEIHAYEELKTRFGHDGEQVILEEMGQILRQHFRNTDRLFHLNDEDFAVLMPNTTQQGAYEVAERVRSVVADYQFGVARKLAVSFGVLAFQEKEGGRAFMKRVGVMLYRVRKYRSQAILVD